uniref:Uncharacterized protein n=1 Tax=Heterorhabditis bacteriophora TaxID=37862 RepID=A0A1I7WAB2_HETBA
MSVFSFHIRNNISIMASRFEGSSEISTAILNNIINIGNNLKFKIKVYI